MLGLIGHWGDKSVGSHDMHRFRKVERRFSQVQDVHPENVENFTQTCFWLHLCDDVWYFCSNTKSFSEETNRDSVNSAMSADRRLNFRLFTLIFSSPRLAMTFSLNKMFSFTQPT